MNPMTIVNSISAALVPVHREGYRFIGIFAAVTLVLFWFHLTPLAWLGVILTLWCAYFFRDPERVTPIGDGLVISPADGRISSIEDVVPPPELDLPREPVTRISVFMNVFDVHVNRSPLDGVIRRIVMAHASCVMLKHEDWPGLEKISALRGFEKDGSLRHISILCGNGGLFLDFEMERGADGAMTGYAFPDMLVDVVRLSAAGKRDEAHDLFDAHLPLLRYEQQPGIGLAVRKYVLMRRGLIASDTQRKPGGAMSAKAVAEVEYLLGRVRRFDHRAKLSHPPRGEG